MWKEIRAIITAEVSCRATNSVWKQDGRETYRITATEEFKGKYLIKAGKEQFVLKLRGVSIQRYLKKYAVLRIEAENFCYPGEADRERINELASCLFAGELCGPDSLEIKIKDGKLCKVNMLEDLCDC